MTSYGQNIHLRQLPDENQSFNNHCFKARFNQNLEIYAKRLWLEHIADSCSALPGFAFDLQHQ